ncbi:MAG: iron-sulfur cluster assembly accessory protein [Thermoanaerobaculia bacterium]|nr:MAG: iron-sulfur cluster assembly accessory protein [Thermoanaerobaculia bacterium]
MDTPTVTPPTSDAPGAEAPAFAITSKAVEMVKKTREQEGMDDSWGLRVAVMGGGCSGFQYALDFEQEARATDHVLDVEGLRVYLDPVSARYLEGVTIDYVFGMNGAGFKFDNPRATGSCGCGHSFAV